MNIDKTTLIQAGIMLVVGLVAVAVSFRTKYGRKYVAGVEAA